MVHQRVSPFCPGCLSDLSTAHSFAHTSLFSASGTYHTHFCPRPFVPSSLSWKALPLDSYLARSLTLFRSLCKCPLIPLSKTAHLPLRNFFSHTHHHPIRHRFLFCFSPPPPPARDVSSMRTDFLLFTATSPVPRECSNNCWIKEWKLIS